MTIPAPEYVHIGQPPTPPTSKRRRRWPIYLAAGIALAAGLGALYWAFAPATHFDVVGTITVEGSGRSLTYGTNTSNCRGASGGGHSDLRPGAQVVIKDASGTIVATGRITDDGKSFGSGSNITRCILPFKVEDVPAGHDFYSIEVTRRGAVTYTADEIREPMSLQIG